MNIILCLFFKIKYIHFFITCFALAHLHILKHLQFNVLSAYLLNNVACASRIRDLALSLSLNKLDISDQLFFMM